MKKLPRFRLASNRYPKLKCPYCQKNRHWQRYMDTQTGEVLPEHFGRCDNEGKCGAWINPYDERYGTESHFSTLAPKRFVQPAKTDQPAYGQIPAEVLKQTLKPEAYGQNQFIQNLLGGVPYPFPLDEVEQVIELYFLGTVVRGYRAGAVTFPFIDKHHTVRAIQVKQFDKANHTTGTDFIHSLIEKHHRKKGTPVPPWIETYTNSVSKVSCLFGEHLLGKYPQHQIALVEAPKTAIYGTLYFGLPSASSRLLWLACYNLSGLTVERCKALRDREVFLFPDLSKDGSSYALWSRKARQLAEALPNSRFTVSDYLENNATDPDREAGLDLADFLVRHDWRPFRPGGNRAGEKSEKGEDLKTTFFALNPLLVQPGLRSYTNWEQTPITTTIGEGGYPADWDVEGGGGVMFQPATAETVALA